MNGRLHITAFARLSDPAWRGDVEPHMLDDRAHLFTDIFLGVIRFSVIRGAHGTEVETRSGNTGIFGCLYMVAEGVASHDGRTVVPDYRGNELLLQVDGHEVRLVGNGQEIVTQRSDMLGAVNAAFADAMALLRAAWADRPLPAPLHEMAAAVNRWAAEA